MGPSGTGDDATTSRYTSDNQDQFRFQIHYRRGEEPGIGFIRRVNVTVDRYMTMHRS